MKQHRLALALLAMLVAMIFVPPAAQRQVFTFRDHADYFQPLRYYTAIHIRSFLLPHWNPYSASGEPWLANPQTGVFYPPTWLFIVLPFEIAYMLHLALHLLILGWGAYLLFVRTLSPGAALVGAAIVTFCGPTMSLLDVSNNLASFAWVPLVIWCAVSRASPRLAALVLALTFLAGEPFFAAIAAAIYAILVRDWKKVAIAGGGAFGLSAIQLLPFLEMLRGSDRAARLSPEQIFAESMPLLDWLRIAIPPKFTAGALDPGLSQHFIAVVYVGIPAVVLAIISVVRRRTGEGDAAGGGGAPLIAWLSLLLFSIIVAAGPGFFAKLPLTLFRYPARVVPFGALAIAALAAMGWERVRPNRRWVDLLLVAIIVADLVPREGPLFALSYFTTDRVPYAAHLGRGTKIIRIPHGAITNRSAWIAGYLNLYQQRYDAASAAPVINERYLRFYEAVLARGRRELFDGISAGFILSDRVVEGLRPVASAGPVTVYLNDHVPPMATFWTRAASHASPDDALRETIDYPDRAALRVSPEIGTGFATAKPLVMSAAFIEVDSRHARVIVDAPREGIAMLTQQDSPAWHVFVDGVEQKKLLAAGIFRAVAVAKGKHEIVWRYRSLSLIFGAMMTAITAALLLVVHFVKRFRSKNFLDHA